jgi:NTP pyrophosphatase (non-canonical NTP hydrolase)
MDFDDYSAQAARSDKIAPGRDKLPLLVFGLNEEAGEIARLMKKSIRNQIPISGLKDDLRRKLGDVLWYLNAISSESDLRLSDVAASNIHFVADRWLTESSGLFGPEREPLSENHERFPDYLVLEFKRELADGLIKLKLRKLDGSQVGDVVDDNEYKEDGYRFHDVIHLAFMAHVGWSPVFRKLLKLKRKSKPDVDRVEDGAKARDVEEAISRRIFVYMEDHDFLKDMPTVDTSFLTSLQSECRGREMQHVPPRMWELAMLNAALVIRQLKEHGEGFVIVDNVARQLTFKRTAVSAQNRSL